jgi:hypothetical protein
MKSARNEMAVDSASGVCRDGDAAPAVDRRPHPRLAAATIPVAASQWSLGFDADSRTQGQIE